MEITIKRDGLNLHGLLEGTDKIENDAIAILMHGFKGDLGYDDSKILYALSHYLNDQGLPTIRFDFDGCGKSDGKFEDMTVYSEILDGIKILDYVRNTVKAKHIYLVGHSQGGVVASMLAGYYRDVIEKLALLAPAATLKSDALDGVCQVVLMIQRISLKLSMLAALKWAELTLERPNYYRFIKQRNIIIEKCC